MQKIQKFGGAMFTPVLLFAFAGISVGIGTLFTTQAIMGGLAVSTAQQNQRKNHFLRDISGSIVVLILLEFVCLRCYN